MLGLEIITSFYLSLLSVSSQLHAGYCPSHIQLYQAPSFVRNVDKFSCLSHHSLARDVRFCSLELLEPLLKLVGDRNKCYDDHCSLHSPPFSPMGSLLSSVNFIFIYNASVAIQIVSEHFTQGLTPSKQQWYEKNSPLRGRNHQQDQAAVVFLQFLLKLLSTTILYVKDLNKTPF